MLAFVCSSYNSTINNCQVKTLHKSSVEVYHIKINLIEVHIFLEAYLVGKDVVDYPAVTRTVPLLSTGSLPSPFLKYKINLVPVTDSTSITSTSICVSIMCT
jgi:hypothetical protein